MENRDSRRIDSRHTPSPSPHSRQQHPNDDDGAIVNPSASQRHRSVEGVGASAAGPFRPPVTDGDDGHRPSPPSVRSEVDLERREQQRRLRNESNDASGGASGHASRQAASANASSSVGDLLTSESTSRRRHRSGEPGTSGRGGGGGGDGNELSGADSRRSPSISPPARRLQRELSLQSTGNDRGFVPRVASLSNQLWVGVDPFAFPRFLPV